MPATPLVRTVAVLGNYLPRLCGLATFTSDLTEALAKASPGLETFAMAMNDRPEGYDYPAQVQFEIHQDRLDEYLQAAEFLGQGPADVLCMQHEYGIYGGTAGKNVLELLRRVDLPLVTTLHTILREPDPDQRTVMDEVAHRSDRLVVMTEQAIQLLREVYDVPRERIALIPHGIPDVPFLDPNYFKEQLGVEGRTVILTFGLLSPAKGIETMIRALPEITREFPDVVYLVLGATHPHVLARDGEAYRTDLQALADELGIAGNVRFHNRFVPLAELCDFLGAAEIYVTPYLGQAQIASGTLAYALGSGNAVVSTPYWSAQDLLADDRGVLTPFQDPQALAANVLALLRDRNELHALRKRAYVHTRSMVWSQVALRYQELFEEVKAERTLRPMIRKRLPSSGVDGGDPPPVLARTAPAPRLVLDHLLELTDDVGVLQHARFSIPRRAEGYCTDDNARALLVAVRAPAESRSGLRLATTRYASFLEHAWDPDGRRFRNFMGYDRRWNEEIGSEDCQGRAVWALGVTVGQGPDWLFRFGAQLFREALPVVAGLGSPRAMALACLGLSAYLKRFPGDRGVRTRREEIAGRLLDGFQRFSTVEWPWPEEGLTYDNARLPQALLQAGRETGNQEMGAAGLRMLEWLMRVQTSPAGHFVPVGNRGWYHRDRAQARFHQQPLEAQASLEACCEAHRTTGHRKWRDRAQTCFAWFLGHNDLQVPVADLVTGGCRDGLHAEGVNLNQGAESTLAWLLSLLTMHEIEAEQEARRLPGETAAPIPRPASF